MLARAFASDPFMIYLMPDEARRRRLLPRMLGAIQRYCLQHGRVNVTDAYDAVAAWLPPGRTDVTPLRMLGAGFATALPPLGLGGLTRMQRLTSAMDADHHRLMPEHHWYLWLLGTDPDRVRRGHAARVLAPVLTQADTAQTPAYLDTHLETNLAFYARQGFLPVTDRVVDGLHYWGLRRDPR